MVYGSGQKKYKQKSGSGIKIAACLFLAAAVLALKVFFPTAVDTQQISELISENWDIAGFKDMITKPREIKQLANDLFKAVFGKSEEPKVAAPAEKEEPLSVMSVRSYGVKDYLSMAGFGEVSSPKGDTKYIMPAAAEITSQYGWRDHPLTGKRSFHTGVDLALNEGDSVYATCNAVVTKTGSDSVYGNYIILSHSNGCESFYAHLNKVLVKEGKTVVTGECIALSGSTGLVTGPHLHFEIRKNGDNLDPMKYIGE